MSSVVVVVPSRGRPEQARLTIQAIRDTAVRISTLTVLAVDSDDPTLPEYRNMIDAFPVTFGPFRPTPIMLVLDPDETGDLVKATNTVSLMIAKSDPYAIIGNLGDDHRPRTEGWDRMVVETLTDKPGIVYGDDLLQGEKLPTAPFISASIVNALGWYALPTCRHMFIDDAWKYIGDNSGAIHYLKDMVIEHVHPGAGKAEMDEGYERADASTQADREAFYDWFVARAPIDAKTVRDLL